MSEELRAFLPEVPDFIRPDDMYGVYPWKNWNYHHLRDYELIKETPRNETYEITTHWFVISKDGSATHYLYSAKTETSGKRFLVVGGPLGGHYVSRYRIGNDYTPFNNAGTSKQTMIWVYKPLLND